MSRPGPGPLEFFPYRNRALFCESVSLAELAERYGTPLYVVSAQALRAYASRLTEALAGINHRVHFAVKANPTLGVLREFVTLGFGGDVVSGGELLRCLRAGYRPRDIVFSGVGKSAAEVELGLEHGGVYSFNVESESELELISRLAGRRNLRARVALRLNPDVDPKTHPSISTGLKKNKFGVSVKDCRQILKRWGSHPNLEWMGLSCHIGSQILDLKSFAAAFRRLFAAVLEAHGTLQKPLESVDVGGGMGVAYRLDGPSGLDCKRYGEVLRRELKVFKGRPPKVLLEPGRYLCANAGVLMATVLHRKSNGPRKFMILDAGMNDLMRPALYDAYHEVVPLVEPKSKNRERLDIVGPVCESTDCFAQGRPMAKSIAAGDRVALLSAGAYGASMSNSYNTRPEPAVVLVDGAQARLIRRRLSVDELLRCEQLVE